MFNFHSPRSPVIRCKAVIMHYAASTSRRVITAIAHTLSRREITSRIAQQAQTMNYMTNTADQTMRAWQTKVFGTLPTLEYVMRPQLWRDDQVLLRVEATSVNPIDTRMTEGYGNEILSRCWDVERTSWNPLNVVSSALRPTPVFLRLPLTVGRDLCGEVVQIGGRVSNVHIGDKVIAVIPVHWPGAHGEFVVAPANALAPKPPNVSTTDACAHAYTANTMWSALTMARVNQANASNCRFLIHGGSGGMGTTTIQFLRAWGAKKIVATCSAKNMDLVRELGATAIDYASQTARKDIINAGPYEVILEYASSPLADWSDSILGIWRNCVHISIMSPLVADTDRYGLSVGLASTFIKYLARSAQPATQGRWFSYAFFMPSGECLQQLSAYMANGKVVPVVEKVYKPADLAQAYTEVGQIHGRGKTVIDFASI